MERAYFNETKVLLSLEPATSNAGKIEKTKATSGEFMWGPEIKEKRINRFIEKRNASWDLL